MYIKRMQEVMLITPAESFVIITVRECNAAGIN